MPRPILKLLPDVHVQSRTPSPVSPGNTKYADYIGRELHTRLGLIATYPERASAPFDSDQERGKGREVGGQQRGPALKRDPALRCCLTATKRGLTLLVITNIYTS